ARAYIVGVVDHPYLAAWSPLWLTLPSYASTTPAVLAVDRTIAVDLALPVPGRSYDLWRIGTTYARSAVRPLGIWPYPCQVGRTTAGALIPASDQLPALGRPRR
ncbi:hypothetical protein GW17_00040519, partial [Ensete ventricosum]